MITLSAQTDRRNSHVNSTKIVVSTNIAETSVTIDDISVVVDCGTHKEMQYDPSAGMSCLVQTRLSRANAAQRAGRAGRVRAGFCFHLFMRRELEEMPPQQLPEMLRCPLESVCLRIKSLKLGFIRDFLSRAIEPPADEAIDHVIAVLAGLNALRSNDDAITVNRAEDLARGEGETSVDNNSAQEEGKYRIEELTPLGTILASLPVDPRIGRMMIYGAIFRCLEPTLIIAASLAFRSPFFSPMDKREEADRVKRSFHMDSDHLTLLRAYRGWERERRAGRTHERGYLFDNFLSGQTLRMIEKMKTQFKRLLQEVGFHDRRRERDYNENSNNQALVKAVLVAGLYPNIVRVQESKKGPPKLKTKQMFSPIHDANASKGGGRGCVEEDERRKREGGKVTQTQTSPSLYGVLLLTQLRAPSTFYRARRERGNIKAPQSHLRS